MPSEFEEYIQHFNEADSAMRKFRVALNDLLTKVTQVRQSAGVLLQPAAGKWPSQEELQEMLRAAESKIAPLQAEYNRLPEETRKYAPQPQNVGKGA